MATYTFMLSEGFFWYPSTVASMVIDIVVGRTFVHAAAVTPGIWRTFASAVSKN